MEYGNGGLRLIGVDEEGEEDILWVLGEVSD
jgi:hypothetical protein